MAHSTEAITSCLMNHLDGISPSPIRLLFSVYRPGYHNYCALKKRFDEESKCLQERLGRKERLEVKKILFPTEPYDLKIMPTLALLGHLRPDQDSHVIQDICIAKILMNSIGEHHPTISPQLIIELLNFYNRRIPELLILADPILRLILLERDSVQRQAIKTRACAVLINHYEIETLIIYISFHQVFSLEEKQTLFQSLTAFQKIYRKFLEVHEWIGNKDQISLTWFGKDFDSLKKEAAFRGNFSNLVDHFFDLLRSNAKQEALQMGRFLVLRFNNEDILRLLHNRMETVDLKNNLALKKSIFRRIHSIMKEFRREYISPKLDTNLTRFIADLEVQSVESMRQIIDGKVSPTIIRRGLVKEGRLKSDYALNPDLAEKLLRHNLTLLFELYPVSPQAQNILFHISQIAEHLELAQEDLVKYIFYLERLLIFLQQLEELKILLIEGTRYGIILNPFQMSSLSMIVEGAYFASTGCWLNSTTPPSVIRCINPHAIPNCLGILDRHIFSRISLLSGAYCGAPFDLDSTNRYDWDEEPETCQIRPGYFLIDIPENLRRSWEKPQAFQRRTLLEKISKKDWL
ncbi:hypothetical protein D4S03_06610 [bacterium]|nr:MAG: hypothetical protein D4S03_06610 [bacterium]